MLSKRAIKNLERLLVYLEEDWSLKVKHSFIQKFDKSLKQIQKLPDSFPESEILRVLRKCVVTRQTTIFYKYSDTTIDIAAIFDNRQNPKALFHELKD